MILFQQIKSLLSKFVKSFIQLNLLLKNYDLFRIYKLKDTEIFTENKSKYQIYVDRELALKEDRVFSRNCHLIILFLFHSYMVIKCSIIGILHRLIYYQHFYGLHTESHIEKGVLIDKLLNFNELIPLDKAKYYYNDLLGHPISEGCPLEYLPAVFLSSIGGFNRSFTTSYWFHYKKPLDIPVLRYFVNPQLELKRLDLLIQLRLDKFLVSTNYYKYKLLTCGHKIFKNDQILSSEDVAIILNRISYYQSLTLDCKNRLNQFRPSNLHSNLSLIELMSTMFFIYFFVSPMGFKGIYDTITMYDCPIPRLETCRQSLSLFDSNSKLIFFSEFIILFTYEVLGLSFHNTIYSFQMIDQYSLIKNLKGELKKCLHKMRLANFFKGNDHFRQEVDRYLLETMTRVSIIQKEFINSVDCMRSTIMFILMEMLTLVVVYVLTEDNTAPDINGVRLRTMLPFFIYFNLMALLSAGITAEVIRQEKLFWSVLCEKVYFDQSLKLTVGINYLGLDFLLLSWQKMTYGAHMNQEKYIVEPFGIQFTYKTILQIDFLAISIYTWLRMI